MRCAHGCVVWLRVVGFGEICSQVARVCSGGAHVHVRRTCVADGIIAAVCFSQVHCMLMTKDELILITGGGSVIVWDMSSGERKSTLDADGEVRCFASCGGALWLRFVVVCWSFRGSLQSGCTCVQWWGARACASDVRR